MKKKRKKKSLVGWMLKGLADTFTIFEGKEMPYNSAKRHGCIKVRITI